MDRATERTVGLAMTRPASADDLRIVAAKSRVLAKTVGDQLSCKRLIEYAEELEQAADRLAEQDGQEAN